LQYFIHGFADAAIDLLFARFEWVDLQVKNNLSPTPYALMAGNIF